jgi:membrane dipeptidase
MNCFDCHGDVWWYVTERRLAGEKNVIHRHFADRFRHAGQEGGIWAVWVDTGKAEELAQPRRRSDQILACAADEIAEAQDFVIVRNMADIRAAKADGKFYTLIGVEGLASCQGDLSYIDTLYDFGAREVMLTWNERNDLAAGASSGYQTGLTDLGRAAVQKIIDKGMIMDVSHLNEAGFWDVADLCAQAGVPFIASHSNCGALCPVPRCLTDEQLRAIGASGGVAALNAYSRFVSHDPARQTVERLADHAMHMIDIMGVDHVALGFDFSCYYITQETVGDWAAPGSDQVDTRGIENPEAIPNLFAEFDKRGLSKEDQEKIATGNIHRVISTVLG